MFRPVHTIAFAMSPNVDNLVESSRRACLREMYHVFLKSLPLRQFAVSFLIGIIFPLDQAEVLLDLYLCQFTSYDEDQ